MHRFNYCVLFALLLTLLFGARASAVNQLVNPGFESPVTTDGAPFVGFWEAFNGGAGSSAANSTTTPRTGAQDLLLSIANTDNTFAGAFQDVAGLSAGTPVSFSMFHMSPSSPLDLTVEVRIEWRNSVSNTEISRTANSNPIPTSSYSQFILNSTVPAGVDTARCVYAIQTFTGGPTNNGQVFVDDASFDLVPEPGSAALAGIAGLALAGIRRRRA